MSSLKFKITPREIRRSSVLVGLFIFGQIVVGLLFDLPWVPAKGADSTFYLDGAQNFPAMTRFQQGYSGYIALLSLGELFGWSEWLPVFAQSVAAIAAARVLWYLGLQLGGPIAGWTAASIYLLHPPISQWTRYILTDSLFYSSVILLAGAFVRLRRDGGWSLLILSTLLTLTVRPNGIIALGALGIALSLTFIQRKPFKILGASTSIVLVLFAALTLPWLSAGGGEVEGESFLSRTAKGNITFGDEERALEMPQPSSPDDSNLAYLRYVISNPIPVLELAAVRIGWEIAQVRPWYSLALNAYLAVSMTLIHCCAVVGFLATRRKPFTLLTTLLSLGWSALIGITWAIYEGRFGWWFMVLWLVWSGVGASYLLKLAKTKAHKAEVESL